MARVILDKNSPLQNISGTYCGYTYQHRNGKVFIHQRPEAQLRKDATRREKKQFKRREIVNRCTHILQQQMDDIAQAIVLRPKLRVRLNKLYKQYEASIKAPTKLQKKIMEEYYKRYDV